MHLFWFRRDLRLEDNTGLAAALATEEEVLPLFIFDKNILSELAHDDARVTFIHQLLEQIQETLAKKGKSLAVFYGEPETIFTQLLKDHPVKAVYTNHDYEPYALQRDTAIANFLQQHQVAFHTFKDQVIFEKSEITKEDGSPYVVYTPYAKKWKQVFREQKILFTDSAKHLDRIFSHNYPFLTLKAIGFEKSKIQVPAYTLATAMITDYKAKRDFPAANPGTSSLSTHLRFGAVSIRHVILKASANAQETFWNELIWREFFMQILWHYPHTVTQNFRPKYDGVQWRNNEEEFKKWCEGTTGYPLVDAGMRQLNATGLMHNRVRMVTASFLCKHLLIDWRWGEAYFAEKLLDYEQSSNIGNWQWAAGCGVDAAPYFRIFNPAEQIKKFDGAFAYTKKWVPEFQELDYRPIVDHKEARERCLRIYKQAVG
ncbi:cryptochrome/photolyase family protein [Flavobacterium kingsejongi]|uniref:Deoxyribodipyrimidine photolyase n=1 Tax=Flavobacterium kingsejongi TaxID=1678728 RepID=A0A2S1LS97_9FLAO|nr:deoxyribodipyrimidine photo-lyase [Flavobacterium kingsejongi]AWG26633.1 deoxyribodipyrimidine photolyase [Flavobacterium kingsejongi]